MSRDTERLRNDIELNRVRMSETLDQIGERLNPGNIKRQIKNNIRDATVGRVGDMARHATDRVSHTREGLMDTVRDNPIPAAMIGIGLGWMLFNGRRGASRSTHEDRYDELSGFAGTGYIGDMSATTPRLEQDDAAGGIGASVSHDHHRTIERVSDVAHRAQERVSDVAHQAQERVSDVAGRVRHSASDIADTGRERAHRVEDRVQRTLQDNPLAVGAVALAVGLAAGFAIPESERESRMMGGTRDRLVDRAREAAGEARNRAKEIAERVIDETSGNGASSDGASGSSGYSASGDSGAEASDTLS